MNDYVLISDEKNIKILEKDDYNTLICFNSSFNQESNLQNIIINRELFILLKELNKDFIIEYNEKNEILFYNLDVSEFNNILDKKVIMVFKQEILEKNNNFNIILNIFENDDIYEKNIIEKIAIDVIFNDKNIEFYFYIKFKNDCELMKKDILILILKKIIYRLKNYCS